MCLALQGMEVRTVPTPDQKRASLWWYLTMCSAVKKLKGHSQESQDGNQTGLPELMFSDDDNESEDEE